MQIIQKYMFSMKSTHSNTLLYIYKIINMSARIIYPKWKSIFIWKNPTKHTILNLVSHLNALNSFVVFFQFYITFRFQVFLIILSNAKTIVQLNTFSYPYTRNYSYYLRPGTILFWKYTKSYFPHGHVALIADSNENETTVIQQNLNPPVKIYNTKELFTKMNCVDSKFLGVKTLPHRIPRIEYNIVRL